MNLPVNLICWLLGVLIDSCFAHNISKMPCFPFSSSQKSPLGSASVTLIQFFFYFPWLKDLWDSVQGPCLHFLIQAVFLSLYISLLTIFKFLLFTFQSLSHLIIQCVDLIPRLNCVCLKYPSVPFATEYLIVFSSKCIMNRINIVPVLCFLINLQQPVVFCTTTKILNCLG